MKAFNLIILSSLLLLSGFSFSAHFSEINAFQTKSEFGNDQQGGRSKIGRWSKEDKKKAKDALVEVRKEIETVLGDDTDAYIDCYLKRVENTYPNFAAADADEAGVTELATKCINEILGL